MSDAKGKVCDFCGAFIPNSEGGVWLLNLVFEKIPARFVDQKAPPNICADCVARVTDVLGCAIEPVAKEDGEIQSIIIRSYRRS